MDTAFIGLDYINQITNTDYKGPAAAQAHNRGVIQHANTILAHGAAAGWLNVLVRVQFAPGGYGAPLNNKFFTPQKTQALTEGTPATQFHPQLHTQHAHAIITKSRISAFYSTGLTALLQGRQIKRLLIAGVSTAFTVLNTAREAADRDYEVYIVEDACAADSDDMHNKAIDLLRPMAGIITGSQLHTL